MIAEKERVQMAAADLVVMPLLNGVTTGEYTNWRVSAKIGYEAAEQKAEMLKQFEVSEDRNTCTYTEARRGQTASAGPRPDEIRISGDIPPNLKSRCSNRSCRQGTPRSDASKLEEQMLKTHRNRRI